MLVCKHFTGLSIFFSLTFSIRISYLLLVVPVVNNPPSLFPNILGSFFFLYDHILERQWDMHVLWLGKRAKDPCVLVVLWWRETAKESSPHHLVIKKHARVRGLAGLEKVQMSWICGLFCGFFEPPAVTSAQGKDWKIGHGTLARVSSILPFAQSSVAEKRFLFYSLELEPEILKNYILKELVKRECIFFLQF